MDGAAIGVQGAHEHGVVRLGLAVDGSLLSLDAQAPADAVFGFEHAPATDEERATVVGALDRIRTEAGSMISLATELGCAVDAVEITEAPDLESAHAEEAPGHDHAGHDTDDGHEHAADHDSGDGDTGHGEDESSHDHAADAGAHSELRFTVSWVCSAPLAGGAATLGVRRLFPDVEFVDLTVITGLGQAAGRVDADASFQF